MYDATQDAYNWYSAVTKIGQLKKVQDTLDFEMAEKIQDLNFDQAKKILIPYLENHKKSSVANFERIMKEQLAKYFAAAVLRLEKVTGHPLAIQNCAENRTRNS